jgi:peptidoglycan/xylan/chitin deacetylase (PgdA/CDA1 family)
MDLLRYIVDYIQSHFEMGTPDDAIALIDGRFESPPHDQLLLTFDDGFASNYDAAVYLNSLGIRAIFFVIPSFVGRSIPEYYAFHKKHGIEAHPCLLYNRDDRGLSPTQIREIVAMGHLVAAHNYSHRDLGRLHNTADLEYEIGRAIADLSDQLQHPCQDFAFGFGRAAHLSLQAAEYLQKRNIRTYSCIRGLNVAGRTAQILGRDALSDKFPKKFTRAVLAGALDDYYRHERLQMERLNGLLPSPIKDI